MIVLKILAAPVMVALSLLAATVTFLFCVASAVCELGCIVLTLLSLILFIGGQTVGGIVFLVLAFLVSPFGVPAIAEWLVDKDVELSRPRDILSRGRESRGTAQGRSPTNHRLTTADSFFSSSDSGSQRSA